MFTACRHQPNHELQRIYSKSYEFHNNKQIGSYAHSVTGKIYYNIDTAGNKTVFQYISSSDIKDASDAGYSSVLTFQADSGVTSFTYTNDELQQHLTNYSSGGAWSYFGPLLISKGYITGQKQGDNWKITIDIVLPEVDETAKLASISETATYKEVNW
jgi:hypothetical protein